MSALYRLLPSIDLALRDLESAGVLAADDLLRPLARYALTALLDGMREAIREGRIMDENALRAQVTPEALRDHVRKALAPRLRRVVNATGVVAHTNLGRSRLPEAAVKAVEQAARWYSNLEFDLSTGERGSRHAIIEELLVHLTGAEAAIAVNNNAAATLIVLDTLAKGREVLVSRGQLVEIGGSFRIPEVMEKSGAALREVGTTNRTHLRDYAGAIGPETGLMMRVHCSNYRIVGFTAEVGLPDLVTLARLHDLPVYDDLGSGTLFDFANPALPVPLTGEATVQECVRAGADVVSFSGDKVLGGPQAGLIVGKKAVIDRIRKNPLARAMRVDKMTFAALEATLRLYLDPERARRDIPTLAMITADPAILKRRAQKLAALLRKSLGDMVAISVVPGASRVGGGAFPERDLPTFLAALKPSCTTAASLAAALLGPPPPLPPLVGRVERDALHLDPRTLDDAEFPLVRDILVSVLAG